MSSTYKEVFTGSAMAVLLLKGVFGDHGIPFVEKNEQASGVLAGLLAEQNLLLKWQFLRNLKEQHCDLSQILVRN